MIKTYTTKRAIIDLMIVKEQVIRIFEGNTKYKGFIEFIFAKDYLDDNDLKLPTIKEISQAIELSSSKVTKLIKELYEEFFENNLDFTKVEIVFYTNYLGNFFQFECNDLKYLPRVGEQIDISFIKAKVGSGMFYVDKIEHTFQNDLQRIYITLTAGIYNKYFHFRKSKAYEQREISFEDFYSGNDYSIRNKLKPYRD